MKSNPPSHGLDSRVKTAPGTRKYEEREANEAKCIPPSNERRVVLATRGEKSAASSSLNPGLCFYRHSAHDDVVDNTIRCRFAGIRLKFPRCISVFHCCVNSRRCCALEPPPGMCCEAACYLRKPAKHVIHQTKRGESSSS